MRILIQLSHPAHFHLYKNIILNLSEKNNEVFVVIKTKDILADLLRNAGLKYYNILPSNKKTSIIGMFLDMVIKDWRIMRLCIHHKIDLLVGPTPEVAHVGWLLRKKHINTEEDDASIIPLFWMCAGVFVKSMLSPISCCNGKWEYKSIKYAGFQKLAYLHPNQFTPDINIVARYFPTDKPFFLLRFAKLNAHHDNGISGISAEIAQRLIDILSNYGNIYITSERALEPQFEKYRLNINPLDIHHIMAFAKLYIGDSQSMAVEAAMLGVPSIRFNSFAGKIGVLEELENKYELTHAISPNHPEELYSFINDLLSQENLKEEYQRRRNKMLADKIDVTAFFTWFIENYPESKKIMKENPDYQYRFK